MRQLLTRQLFVRQLLARPLLTAALCFGALLTVPLAGSAQQAADTGRTGLSLITASPDDGFALAITLARRTVSTIQTNREVLMEGRAKYSVDPDSLIAASQVVAVHFQTIAQANDYWKD
ncbi:MAG TPA: hypothetical protein GX696_06300 [Pseudomonadaceae bacterium]|nr:hypothetical protein [Pseudomonadaceae bacterium]